MAGKILKKICLWCCTLNGTEQLGGEATKGDITRTGATGVKVPVASSGNGSLPESSFPCALVPVFGTRSWAAGRAHKVL